jgi:hypothetical protein
VVKCSDVPRGWRAAGLLSPPPSPQIEIKILFFLDRMISKAKIMERVAIFVLAYAQLQTVLCYLCNISYLLYSTSLHGEHQYGAQGLDTCALKTSISDVCVSVTTL